MVGDLVILLAIGADFVPAHPGTDHFFPPGVSVCFRLRCFPRQDASLKHLSGDLPISMLRLCRRFGLDPGRLMAHHHAGLRLVAVLAAGAGILGCKHFDVAVAQDVLRLFGKLENCDGNGRSVDAPTFLGRGYSLPAMAAGFFQQGPNGVVRPAKDDSQSGLSIFFEVKRQPGALRIGGINSGLF